MIRKSAYLAIDRGIIKDLDVLKTMGGPFTSADPNNDYIAAIDIEEGN